MEKKIIFANAMSFFTDCPKCGQETNRDGVNKILEEVYNQARQETIEEIDKVYKKEGGIRNWLDLREKLLKDEK